MGNSHFTNVIPLITLYMQANLHHRKIPFRETDCTHLSFAYYRVSQPNGGTKADFPGTLKPRKKVQ